MPSAAQMQALQQRFAQGPPQMTPQMQGMQQAMGAGPPQMTPQMQAMMQAAQQPMQRARGGRIEVSTPGVHNYGMPKRSKPEDEYGGGSGLGRQEKSRRQK